MIRSTAMMTTMLLTAPKIEEKASIREKIFPKKVLNLIKLYGERWSA